MVEQKQSYSKWFYAAVAAGACGILAGSYYLYTLFKGDFELSENDKLEIMEDLTKPTENSKNEKTEHYDPYDSDGNFVLNSDTAFKILGFVNRKSEERMKLLKPDIEERRRNAYIRKDEQEYEQICAEMMEEKQKISFAITEKIMNEFNIKQEDLAKVFEGVNQYEMEKRLYTSYKPEFENGKPPKDKVREIFKIYGQMMLDLMKRFYSLMNTAGQDEYHQQMMISNMMLSKLQIEDEIYVRYQLSEHQIRYLLFEYKLNEEHDINALVMKMYSFDQMFMGPNA